MGGIHAPVEGTPYLAVLLMMVAKESQKVGTNKDSVTCRKLPKNAFGKKTNLAVRAVTSIRKKTRFRMKTIVPSVSRPRNRWGVSERRSAMPPVDIVRVKLAHVKWCMRSRRGILDVVLGMLSRQFGTCSFSMMDDDQASRKSPDETGRTEGAERVLIRLTR